MVNRYIFDVDGTLTPSRGTIDPEFELFFEHFCSGHSVSLVTGSDRAKTLEQVGQIIPMLCDTLYQCAGNDVWVGDRNIATHTIQLYPDMQEFFDHWVESSPFKYKTGTHVEVRPGLINFSTIGRGATKEQRAEYVIYDKQFGERDMIAKLFNLDFTKYNMVATVAGEIGIDITEIGRDKAQIIRDFSAQDKLYFFGDKMDPNGNDYALALKIAQSGGNVYHVKDWRETWKILKKL